MIDDWDFHARKLGYCNEKDMFEKLYLTEERSIGQLAELLNSGTATISRRLELCNITKRGRGGDNNRGLQTWKLSHFDQRVVLSIELNQLPKLTGISRSLWYKYRKSRCPNGILHPKPDRRARTLQHAEQTPPCTSPHPTSEIRRVLPEEESSR